MKNNLLSCLIKIMTATEDNTLLYMLSNKRLV